jgi:hypothetical protein
VEWTSGSVLSSPCGENRVCVCISLMSNHYFDASRTVRSIRSMRVHMVYKRRNVKPSLNLEHQVHRATTTASPPCIGFRRIFAWSLFGPVPG